MSLSIVVRLSLYGLKSTDSTLDTAFLCFFLMPNGLCYTVHVARLFCKIVRQF